MADFLKDNFPSLKNKIKNIKGAISDKEREFLQKSLPVVNTNITKEAVELLKRALPKK